MSSNQEIKYLAMVSDSAAIKYFKSVENTKFIKTHKRDMSMSVPQMVPIQNGLKRKRDN
jgi:ribosomal protein S19